MSTNTIESLRIPLNTIESLRIPLNTIESLRIPLNTTESLRIPLKRSYMGPNLAEWVQFITASENSRHGAKLWLFLDHFNIYPDRDQNSGPQLFHWSCHWVRGILLSPASPWLHLVGREKLAASIKSPMLHSISKTLPVQSSVSFGTIIWAKIDYLFLPHLLQQVQASPLYCHLFQHSLETKDKPGWDDQGWFHP